MINRIVTTLNYDENTKALNTKSKKQDFKPRAYQ